MKKIKILLIFLFSSLMSVAQTQDRVPVFGNLQMPAGEEVQGIRIHNMGSDRGTTTNIRGEFRIPVAVNDSLMVSSIQFQEFIIVVDKGVVDTGQLNIIVNEVGNKLPQVVVSPYDLTGNVTVDVTRLEVVEVPDTLTSVEVQSMYFEEDAAPDVRERPRFDALDPNHSRMEDSRRFARLFRELVTTTQMKKEQRPDADIDMKLRALYDDEFFRENLDIRLENINDFIYFADDNGLSKQMLEAGNELELIDFLVEQSKKYKAQRTRN